MNSVLRVMRRHVRFVKVTARGEVGAMVMWPGFMYAFVKRLKEVVPDNGKYIQRTCWYVQVAGLRCWTQQVCVLCHGFWNSVY
jgi:hypothetical protein